MTGHQAVDRLRALICISPLGPRGRAEAEEALVVLWALAEREAGRVGLPEASLGDPGDGE